jgi:hypothetical protein
VNLYRIYDDMTATSVDLKLKSRKANYELEKAFKLQADVRRAILLYENRKCVKGSI